MRTATSKSRMGPSRRNPRRATVVAHHRGSKAGAQVPAGGVRSSETLEEAVLREVYEETGLKLNGLRLRTQLLTEDKPHPLTGQPRSTTFFVIGAVLRRPRSVCCDGDGGVVVVEVGQVVGRRRAPWPVARGAGDRGCHGWDDDVGELVEPCGAAAVPGSRAGSPASIRPRLRSVARRCFRGSMSWPSQ